MLPIAVKYLYAYLKVYWSTERLDQGHLYPLGEHRDKHAMVGARTSAPLHRRRVLYLKSYLQLIHRIFGTSTEKPIITVNIGEDVQYRVWIKCVPQPDTMPILGIQLFISNDRNRVRWVVLGLSLDGACTDLFENLISLKGDLSNDNIVNPPLFSLFNTFQKDFQSSVLLFFEAFFRYNTVVHVRVLSNIFDGIESLTKF